jgi:GH24 family phage-related lysozyme (muramidase)
MTYASVRAAAQHLVRQGHMTPHQLAAFSALDQGLTEAQRQAFTTMWRDAGSPAAPRPPVWLEPARAIVKEYEGCRLQAYLCPAGVPTIGWGHTHGVQLGQTITQAQAEALLEQDLQRFADGIHELIPASRKLGGNQQAALISWAFNVGLGAVERSTLRRRINAGESPVVVVPEELPRWNKGDGEVLLGLVRRRAAEVALFAGNSQPAHTNPLKVPFYSQLDSTTNQARRMCFSSSCAMLLAYLQPMTLTGPNGDDEYLKRVQKYGDTTSAIAQINALASYEVKADFVKNADFALIERQIRAGFPVPCGYLHRGPVSSPSGSGHWLCVVGYDATHVIVHDPLGEADLITGATLNRPARFCRYSRKNFGRRWMVEGPGTGWAIVAKR